jgi:hypothetical protein
MRSEHLAPLDRPEPNPGELGQGTLMDRGFRSVGLLRRRHLDPAQAGGLDCSRH